MKNVQESKDDRVGRSSDNLQEGDYARRSTKGTKDVRYSSHFLDHISRFRNLSIFLQAPIECESRFLVFSGHFRKRGKD